MVVGMHVPYGQLDEAVVVLLVVGGGVLVTQIAEPQTWVIDGEHIDDVEPVHVLAVVITDEQDDDMTPTQGVVAEELVLVLGTEEDDAVVEGVVALTVNVPDVEVVLGYVTGIVEFRVIVVVEVIVVEPSSHEGHGTVIVVIAVYVLHVEVTVVVPPEQLEQATVAVVTNGAVGTDGLVVLLLVIMLVVLTTLLLATKLLLTVLGLTVLELTVLLLVVLLLMILLLVTILELD